MFLRLLVPILAASVPAFAAAQAIDAKTGLWETTVKIDAAGMASMVDTSGMSPEQKARVEAMMKGMGNGGMPREHTSKSCVTADDLKNSAPGGDDADCTYHYTTRTSTKVAGTVSCTKRGATQTGDFNFETKGREQMQGTMHMKLAKGGATPGSGDMTIDMSSRWLGGDCGDVKPRLAKKP